MSSFSLTAVKKSVIAGFAALAALLPFVFFSKVPIQSRSVFLLIFVRPLDQICSWVSVKEL